MSETADPFAEALAAHRAGNFGAAEPVYRQTVASHPEHAQAWHLLGVLLHQRGQHAEAVTCLERAVRLAPQDAASHGSLALAYRAAGRLDAGVASLHEAVRLNPGVAQFHSNLGAMLKQRGHFDDAIDCYREALRLMPEMVEAHNNLGSAFRELWRLDESLASYLEALRLKPDYADAHSNLALTYKALGRYQESLASCDDALRYQPDLPVAHFTRGLVRLVLGDFSGGWPDYEWRWKCPEFPPHRRTQPLWDGSPLDGRTILLHAEQGLGDTMQFVRYAPLVQARGGIVVFECQGPLKELLSRSPGIDQLIASGEPLPPHDVQVPLMSLPGIFGADLQNIPAPIPYLATDPTLVDHWRRELAGLDGFKVGIVWQGSTTHRWDRYRSLPLAEFAPLARVPRVRLFSLQKGTGCEQLEALSRSAAPFPIVDLGSQLDNQRGAFVETAAAIQALDLVIASDTAIAHLGGGLGVEVWLALCAGPDWRWLLQRSDTPWYPNMRLFRQDTLGEWRPVFEAMRSALQAKSQSSNHKSQTDFKSQI